MLMETNILVGPTGQDRYCQEPLLSKLYENLKIKTKRNVPFRSM